MIRLAEEHGSVLLTVYRRYGKNTPHGLLTGIFFASVFMARFGLEYTKQYGRFKLAR